MDRDEVEVHKLTKKERGQYPAILAKQAWSIKDLLYGFRGNLFLRDPADGAILAAWVANHSARFGKKRTRPLYGLLTKCEVKMD